MKINFFKPIIFLCLIMLLNACGIGHYHHLNLVRPDKKSATVLVKPKTKLFETIEIDKIDTAIIEANNQNNTVETAKIFLEKTQVNEVPFLNKKPSQNAKSLNLGLKEKVLLEFEKNKIASSKIQKNELNKTQVKPVLFDGWLSLLLSLLIPNLLFLIALTIIILYTGFVFLSIDLTIALWLLIPTISIWLIVFILKVIR